MMGLIYIYTINKKSAHSSFSTYKSARSKRKKKYAAESEFFGEMNEKKAAFALLLNKRNFYNGFRSTLRRPAHFCTPPVPINPTHLAKFRISKLIWHDGASEALQWQWKQAVHVKTFQNLEHVPNQSCSRFSVWSINKDNFRYIVDDQQPTKIIILLLDNCTLSFTYSHID